MDRLLCVRWKRIFNWIIAITVTAIIIWILDIVWLQKNPLIRLDNYSDIVLAIWGTQTTISSLTLASAAFILEKIDDSYYGISIKNLLHLSRYFPKICLSFWEEIICSIVLPVVTLCFVILDNINAAIFLFVITVCLSIAILIECINVITKSEIYSEWALGVVNQLVDIITDSGKESLQTHKDKAKEQLRIVLDGIETEVSAEIRRGVDIYENSTYLYFIRLMDRYEDEDMVQFNEQMHHILIRWLGLAINIKSEENVCRILRMSYSESLESRWSATGINVFMNSYYNGDISASCFRREIDRISKDILQAYSNYSAKALFVLRNAIYYADENTFVQIIKAVWRSHPYHNSEMKSNVLITAMVYLYYMAFKEPYMPIEKGYRYLEKLRVFSDAIILESYGSNKPKTITDILSDTRLVFGGVNFVLNFFDDRAFNWEYVSLGEAKSARLGNDTIEFLTFYCYLFFKDIYQMDLSPIQLNVLLKMKSYMTAYGVISEVHSSKYIEFCKWLGKEEKSSQVNERFYNSLIKEIKEKMVIEAKNIREKREIWIEKMRDMRKEVVNGISESALCIGTPIEEPYIRIRFSDFCFLEDFSEQCAVYGIDQVVRANLEANLFYQVQHHNMIDRCGVKRGFSSLEESVNLFEEMVQKMDEKGVNINRSYNFSFFNRFSPSRISPHVDERIKEFNSLIQDAGYWDTGYADITIYVDSGLATMGFYIPNNEEFMTVVEELTEKELRYVCQRYKVFDGFLFKETSNSVGISFTEKELIEYLRIAMVKIKYTCPAMLPRHKIGFMTYYTE